MSRTSSAEKQLEKITIITAFEDEKKLWNQFNNALTVPASKKRKLMDSNLSYLAVKTKPWACQPFCYEKSFQPEKYVVSAKWPSQCLQD